MNTPIMLEEQLGGHFFTVKDINNQFIAEVEEPKENAELIVHRVNTFPKLVNLFKENSWYYHNLTHCPSISTPIEDCKAPICIQAVKMITEAEAI